eukprot:1159567-Pelagomonas_calceolata.AAC.6
MAPSQANDSGCAQGLSSWSLMFVQATGMPRCPVGPIGADVAAGARTAAENWDQIWGGTGQAAAARWATGALVE